MAPRDITPGDDWPAAITEAIDSCSSFILLVSSNSVGSQQVRIELERAVTKDKTVIPIMLHETALSGWMSYFISSKHWYFLDHDEFQDSLSGLFPALDESGEALFSRDITLLDSFIADEVESLSGHLRVLEDRKATIPVPGRMRPVTVLYARILKIRNCSGEEAESLTRNTCAGIFGKVVNAYGGVVEILERGGIAGLFGIREPRDDDARRAVSCAIRIEKAVKSLNETKDLRGLYVDLGIGVASGMARTGSRSEEFVLFSEGPFQRARDLSRNSSVVVSEETRNLCASYFHWIRSTEGWKTASSSPSRADRSSVPVFCGREKETARLSGFLFARTPDRGAVVAEVSGESGIGKTSFARRLSERLCESGQVTTFRGRCHSFSETPLYMWRTLLGDILGVSPENPPSRGVLENSLQDDLSEENLILLKRVFGLKASKKVVSHEDPPLETALMIAAMLERAAGDSAILMLLDDIQWIDRESRRVLEKLLSIMEWKICPRVVLLRRTTSGREPPEPLYRDSFRMMLSGLERDACENLVLEILKAGTDDRAPVVYQGTLELITEKTRGNPLAVRSLLDNALICGTIGNDTGKWRFTGELGNIPLGDIPSILFNQLSSLPPQTEKVIQSAAIVGSEFSLDIVTSLCEKTGGSPYGIQGELEKLCKACLIHGTGHGHYRFTSEVVREVVVSTILPVNRGMLHRLAAEFMEDAILLGASVDTALMFSHYFAAGDALRAFFHGRNALQDMLDNCQYESAVVTASRVFQVTEWPDFICDPGERADFLLHYAEACRESGEWKKAYEIYGRAWAFAEKNQLERQELQSRTCRAQQLVSMGENHEAAEECSILFHDERLSSFPVILQRVNRNMGVALWRMGKNQEAEEYFRRNLAIASSGNDPLAYAVSLGNIAMVCASRGEMDKALELTGEKLAIVRDLGNLKEEAIAESNLGAISAMKGDFLRAAAHFRRQLEIDEATGRRQGILAALSNLANLAGKEPGTGDQLDLYRQAETLARKMGDRSTLTHVLGNMASVLFSRQMVTEAVSVGREALKLAEATGDPVLVEKNRANLKKFQEK